MEEGLIRAVLMWQHATENVYGLIVKLTSLTSRIDPHNELQNCHSKNILNTIENIPQVFQICSSVPKFVKTIVLALHIINFGVKNGCNSS